MISGIGKVFEDYHLGEIRKEIQRLEKLLNGISLWSDSVGDIQRYRLLERHHDDLLRTRETIWRKRRRRVWLKDGDMNTKFFHGKASQRSKVNHIKKIRNRYGVWWRGDEKVESVFLYYFQDVQSLVLSILNNQRNYSHLNKTFIFLIPKCENHITPNNFRPISLYNINMKIVTKVLTKQNQTHSPLCYWCWANCLCLREVYHWQCPWSYGIFHWLKKKKKKRQKGVMTLKLDMSKAKDIDAGIGYKPLLPWVPL